MSWALNIVLKYNAYLSIILIDNQYMGVYKRVSPLKRQVPMKIDSQERLGGARKDQKDLKLKRGYK